MSCRDLTLRLGTRVVILVMATRLTCPVNCLIFGKWISYPIFQPGFKKFWKKIFQSEASVAIMQDAFWWIFLQRFQVSDVTKSMLWWTLDPFYKCFLTHWSLRYVAVIFKSLISKHMLRIKFMSTSCEIALRLMPHNTLMNHDKSTFVLVMAWCQQAASHYLSKFWTKIYIAIWCLQASMS